MKFQNKDTNRAHKKDVRRRCVMCGKKLKIFETSLCSCNENLCMKHRNKDLHKCVSDNKVVMLPPRMVAAKVSHI